jgi:tRNA uridine 5-carboxymethylaminomethyl modification enzyme
VTLDPFKIGVMSCNPAIGGLAKGQIVREVDALGGVMGLATDAAGIQFKVLNTSKGAAVHGPRAQCDKHAYAEVVQAMVRSRPEIEVIGGSVERLVVERGRVVGVEVLLSGSQWNGEWAAGRTVRLDARAVVLTTGTFMRGLMHTGESKTQGGRFGEAAAVGISGALAELGFELGRLKTGTPPRLSKKSIRWDELDDAPGDEVPAAFSELTGVFGDGEEEGKQLWLAPEAQMGFDGFPSLARFPVLEQVMCKQTRTTAAAHEMIRANLHRAPMYSGQIESAGPRYCPSIEDKVVRFAERDSHGVFLEPESLKLGHNDWVYCNGISTSLPKDVQDMIVRSMPGCEAAEILRYGYAVEYDMVKPHQIMATGMTKLVEGLFLAGQINGTSGYEEAAGQGLIAGLNAALLVQGRGAVTLGREQAYIGVMMDDLCTKTPKEPYRMFTSRAEHRLLLRSDNAPDRLTELAERVGLLKTTALGRMRAKLHAQRREQLTAIGAYIDQTKHEGAALKDLVRRPEFDAAALTRVLPPGFAPRAIFTAHTERVYAAYIERQRAEVRRAADMERKTIPAHVDYMLMGGLRAEAKEALQRFKPSTLGQAARLEGLTPADITLLAVLLKKHGGAAGARATTP